MTTNRHALALAFGIYGIVLATLIFLAAIGH